MKTVEILFAQVSKNVYIESSFEILISGDL